MNYCMIKHEFIVHDSIMDEFNVLSAMMHLLVRSRTFHDKSTVLTIVMQVETGPNY